MCFTRFKSPQKLKNWIKLKNNKISPDISLNQFQNSEKIGRVAEVEDSLYARITHPS